MQKHTTHMSQWLTLTETRWSIKDKVYSSNWAMNMLQQNNIICQFMEMKSSNRLAISKTREWSFQAGTEENVQKQAGKYYYLWQLYRKIWDVQESEQTYKPASCLKLPCIVRECVCVCACVCVCVCVCVCARARVRMCAALGLSWLS